VIEDYVNISINDEMSSRPIQNVRSTGVVCNACRLTFNNNREYEAHFSYCGSLRTNNMMHNRLSEILQLVNSLNRHLQGDGRISILQMLGQEEPEEVFDYFDWEYSKSDKEETIWKKIGTINLNSK
jgi:hypothetical protein